MRIDITTYGRQLEILIGQYMLPYETGLYVPTNACPVIRMGLMYRVIDSYRKEHTYSGDKLVANPKLIIGDVFSEKGELVLPVRAVCLLANTPYLPHRSFLLIETICERILHNHFALSKEKNEEFFDIIDGYMMSKYRNSEGHIDDNISLAVINALQPLIGHVKDFMGKDIYHVHFLSLQGSDLVIEKSIDYRIQVFNEKVASGEWNV